jgi:hypothetical protein
MEAGGGILAMEVRMYRYFNAISDFTVFSINPASSIPTAENRFERSEKPVLPRNHVKH